MIDLRHSKTKICQLALYRSTSSGEIPVAVWRKALNSPQHVSRPSHMRCTPSESMGHRRSALRRASRPVSKVWTCLQMVLRRRGIAKSCITGGCCGCNCPSRGSVRWNVSKSTTSLKERRSKTRNWDTGVYVQDQSTAMESCLDAFVDVGVPENSGFDHGVACVGLRAWRVKMRRYRRGEGREARKGVNLRKSCFIHGQDLERKLCV